MGRTSEAEERKTLRSLTSIREQTRIGNQTRRIVRDEEVHSFFRLP